MLSRLARWWLARQERRRAPVAHEQDFEECETCGAEVPVTEVHAVVAHHDDRDLGIDGGGGTMGRADFCAEHCPGDCRLGCATTTG